MVLDFRVLGDVRRDNAVLATIDSGQQIHRFLFDCGNDVLDTLAVPEIQAIDHLLFSHYHMDHISGFDSFFRLTFSRTNRANHIWGPPDTSHVMLHRFQGYLWNWAEWGRSAWHAHDIYPDQIESFKYFAKESFSIKHPLETVTTDSTIINTADYTVEAMTLNHDTPSMAYILREKNRLNVDTSKLKELGLQGGTWVRDVKDMNIPDETKLDIADTTYTIGALRDQLLIETTGESLAYFTDFLMDADTHTVLVDRLHGVTHMICESQYLGDDLDLARKNHHVTAVQVAEVAKQAEVGDLTLIHVSERYPSYQLRQMLSEAQSIFPNTQFPSHWRLD